MTWRRLRGGNEKCSQKSSRGLNLTQPAISVGVRTIPSFASNSAEATGMASRISVSSSTHARGRTGTHCFQILKESPLDASQCILLLFLYHLLQVIHRLVPPGFYREENTSDNLNSKILSTTSLTQACAECFILLTTLGYIGILTRLEGLWQIKQ